MRSENISYLRLRAFVRDMGETPATRRWVEAADSANVAGYEEKAIAHLLRAAWYFGYEARRVETKELAPSAQGAGKEEPWRA